MPIQQKETIFEEKLPARITGVVFWGVVFVGLLIAIVILRGTVDDIDGKHRMRARVLAYEIEQVLSDATADDWPSIRPELVSRMKKLRQEMSFHAVDLQFGERRLSFGQQQATDSRYQYKLHAPASAGLPSPRLLTVYFPDVHQQAADIRKHMLLSIGLGVFVFGLFLQQVLHRLLSAPFYKMVQTARRFSPDRQDIRFDDSRQDEFGYLAGFINNVIDVILQHQRELEQALDRASFSERALSIEKEHAEVTLYAITDSVITVGRDECIKYINPAAEALLGVEMGDVIGKPFAKVFHLVDENSLEPLPDVLKQCFDGGESVFLPDHSSMVIDGHQSISIEASIAPMKSESGDIIGAVMVIQDVSHTRRLTRQLSYQASHDLLTGLYNRRKFDEHLESILANVVAEKRTHCLFYLDLDNFKIVNDTCGHVAGDELLKQLPALFHDVLRGGDMVARLGGDEFGIILENCQLKQAIIIAEKIRHKIKDYRFIWNDRSFEIGVSIGIVAITEKNAVKAEVLSAADMACYAAKDRGRNRLHVFEESDAAVAERFGQMHWTAKISDALENKRFRLYQQPIRSLHGDGGRHVEILVRMAGLDNEVIPPGAFLPAAERYGFMPDIDRWVIHETFRHFGALAGRTGEADAYRIITINLSGDSINDETLLDYIFDKQAEFAIPFGQVCFEITETVAIRNLAKASEFIQQLKSHGCHFALDDFGSGLSSFAYLKSLPVDYLKIDGSFVGDVSHDKVNHSMIVSIQQIADALQLHTIAEHVEDEATLQTLKNIGIDFVQGFYVGEPEEIELQPVRCENRDLAVSVNEH